MLFRLLIFAFLSIASPFVLAQTACPAPQGLSDYNITHESAQINWYTSGNVSPTYQIQYQAIGASGWTTKPIQSSTYGSLTNLVNDTDYQWRVRSICAAGDTSAFSSPLSFRTVCYPPSNAYTSDVTYQGARMNWYGSAASTTYDLYWRTIGAANWTIIAGLTNTSLPLSGLTNDTSYEWKVRGSCSATATSAFTPTVVFRTQCTTPLSPTTSIVAVDAAELKWTNAPGIYIADVRWRVAGVGTWTEVSGLTSAEYALLALTPNTTHEWQVRSACSATDKSAYTASALFMTRCDMPTNTNVSVITYNQAVLNWSSAVLVNLQYRAAGSANWLMVNNTSSPYSLTGLTNNTAYEWQVSAACAPGFASAYTPTQLFATRCTVPLSPYSTVNTNNDVVFSWNGEVGNVYELQWRVAGTTAWTVVPGLASSQYTLSSPSLNTTYEWRVRHACSTTDFSDFTPVNTVTATCQAGYFSLFTYQTSATSINLNWNASQSGVAYELQWRPSGVTSWTAVPGLTTPSYSLTGLAVGGQYDWRLRRMCTATIGSDYSYTNLFTLQCRQPTSLYVSNIGATSALLNWYSSYVFPPYDLRYRPAGQANWLTISNIVDLPFSLTGLTTNTTYEWQVRSTCSPSSPAPFGPSQTFTAQCGGIQADLAVQSATPEEVKVRWYGQTGSAFYDIQYRETGTATWTTKTVPAVEVEQEQQAGIGQKLYTFYGLPAARSYDWRIRAVCEGGSSSAYAEGPAFNTYCQFNGIYSATSQPENSRFVVNWNAAGATDTYKVQWRPQGSSTWLTDEGITGSSYAFTNLQVGTTYEYTVQRICTASQQSGVYGYTQLMRCQPPSWMAFTARSGNSVTANRSYAAATAEELMRTAFTIQYRVSGTTSWTQVTVPANTAVVQYPSLAYPLTGLTSGVSYEMQIRAECTPQAASDYSYSTYYTISCPVPNSPQTATGSTSARLSWYISLTGTPSQLQWRQTGSTTWTTVSVPGVIYNMVTAHTLTGLASNTNYQWRVATECTGGLLSDYTTVQVFTTGCVVPAASNLYATAGATSAYISWSYYSPFFGTSVVQYRPANTVTWLDANAQTSTSLSLTGLSTGTIYELRIRSLCDGGEAWAASNPVQFQTICRNVTSPYASAQQRTAQLTWSADSPVTLQWRPVGTTTWAEVSGIISPFELTGLTPGTTYEYRFQAVCSSTVASGYTAPTTFTTSSLSTELMLQIDSTGMQFARLRIVNPSNLVYSLQWRVAGSNVWINSGPLTSSTYWLQSLVPGTAYEARLAKTVAGGVPTYTYVSSFNTYCPYVNSVETSSTAAQTALLRWSLSRPLSVVLQWRVGGTTTWNTVPSPITGTSYSLTGLSSATSYEWRVAPACGLSSVSYSRVSTFRTPALCQAPAYAYAYSGNVSISTAKLYWTAYSTPAQFTIRYRAVGTSNWTIQNGVSSNPYTLTGLLNTTTYDWAVGVDCGQGATTFSSSSRFTTQCSSVYTGSVTTSPTQAELSWSGGGPDYVVRWRPQGAANWNTATVLTNRLVLSGLTPNENYEWQVRDVCSGNTEAAYANKAVFQTQCSSPSLYNLQAKLSSANAVLLSWQAGSSSATDLNLYTIGWRVQGTTTWATQSGLTSPFSLTGLANNTTYEWQVRTDCSTRFNDPLVFQTTCSVTDSHLIDQQANTTARLVWNDALEGATYELQWRVVGATVWNIVPNLLTKSFTLTGLTNGVLYEWQVRGNCAGGSSFLTTTSFRLSDSRIYSTTAGAWNNPSTWSCGCVPTATDAVLIRHVVALPANYRGSVKRIFYETNGQLKEALGSVIRLIP